MENLNFECYTRRCQLIYKVLKVYNLCFKKFIFSCIFVLAGRSTLAFLFLFLVKKATKKKNAQHKLIITQTTTTSRPRQSSYRHNPLPLSHPNHQLQNTNLQLPFTQRKRPNLNFSGFAIVAICEIQIRIQIESIDRVLRWFNMVDETSMCAKIMKTNGRYLSHYCCGLEIILVRRGGREHRS